MSSAADRLSAADKKQVLSVLAAAVKNFRHIGRWAVVHTLALATLCGFFAAGLNVDWWARACLVLAAAVFLYQAVDNIRALAVLQVLAREIDAKAKAQRRR